MKSHVLRLNGKVVSRREFLKRRGVLGNGHAPGSRSLLPCSHSSVEGFSIGCSVPPCDVEKMNKFVEEHGIKGVYFDPRQKHNCRVTSNAGFAEFLKKTGRENADAGFNGY